MIKQLKKNDILLSPFVAIKSQEAYNIDTPNGVNTESDDAIAYEYIDHTGPNPLLNFACSIGNEHQIEDTLLYEEGVSGSGIFYSNSEPVNHNNSYKRLVYNQMKSAFYNNYNNPLQIFGMENVDFPLSKTNRFLSDNFRMFEIPQSMFGDRINPGSVRLYDTALDDNVNIYDDACGNLMAGPNLFSKVQELRHFPNVISQGYSSYACPETTGYDYMDLQPIAKFIASPTNGFTPLVVNFQNKSSDALSYEWNFGDGSTSTDINPSHIYTTAGTYSVQLTASNGIYNNKIIKPKYITPITSAIPPDFGDYKVEFYANPITAVKNTYIKFYNASTSAPSYEWNFGDGNTSTDINPSHIYTTAGTYSVQLTASYTEGDKMLRKEDYIKITTTPIDITAYFISDPNGIINRTTYFGNQSTGALTYEWYFGDGSEIQYSDNFNMSIPHTYKTIGTYTVVLTAINGDTRKTFQTYISIDYPIFHCNETFYVNKTSNPDSNPDKKSIYKLNAGTIIGEMEFDVSVCSNPMRIVATLDGSKIFDSGYMWNNGHELTDLNTSLRSMGEPEVTPTTVKSQYPYKRITFNKLTHTNYVYVTIYTPLGIDAEEFKISCPGTYLDPRPDVDLMALYNTDNLSQPLKNSVLSPGNVTYVVDVTNIYTATTFIHKIISINESQAVYSKLHINNDEDNIEPFIEPKVNVNITELGKYRLSINASGVCNHPLIKVLAEFIIQ